MFFCKSIPSNPRRKWQQHPLKRLPWLPILAILAVILLAAVSAMILYYSDGKATSDWPSRRFTSSVLDMTPSVFLAISAVLSNTLLRFALLESQPVFWWRKALRPDGTTVRNLHNYYEHGHSVLESLGAGKNFNLMSLTRLITTLAVVQGPLFQRSSRIILERHVFRQMEITLPVSVNPLPNNFTSAASQSTEGEAATDTQESEMFSLTPEFSSVLKDFSTQTPIVFKSECNGTCTGQLVAAGFDVDCHESTDKYDLSNSAMQTVILIDVSFSSPGLAVRTSHKPSSQLGCTGDITVRNCSLRPAIVRYNFTLEHELFKLKKRIPGQNDTAELYDASAEQQKEGEQTRPAPPRRPRIGPLPLILRRDPATVAEYLPNITHISDETPPEEVAPEFLGFYGIALAAERIYDSLGIVIPSKNIFKIINGSSLPYEYVNSAGDAHGSCAMTWEDPTDDILESIREMGFRAAIAASKFSNTSQTINISEQTQQLVYRSDFRYLYAALTVPLLAVLGTIALFYGWWELGRTVSLSPIEIAKAFDAPLLKGKGTNAGIGELLDEIGHKKVRYGEAVVQKNVASNSEMLALIERNVKRKESGLCHGDDDDGNSDDNCGDQGNEEGSSGVRFLVMGAPYEVTSPVEGTPYE